MKTNHLSRRSFIRQSTGLVFTSSLLGAPLAGLAAGKGKGIPVTCRDHHLKEAGAPDCWAAMKAIGVSGVELTVDEKLACPSLFHPTKKYSLDTPDNIRALKDDMAQAGAAFPAFLMHNRFDERLDDELVWM